MLEFDNTKSRNVENTENYSGSIAKFYYDTEKSYTLLINQDGTANILIGGTKYPINGISGKVKDGMIGSYYQGTEISVFLLLEDGTVVSVKGFDIYKQIGFEMKEKLEGVKDIVRLETVINKGDKRLPIAIDSEGYYYSIK